MRRRVMWGLMIAATLAGVGAYVGNALATPASGFSGTTLAVGRFRDIDTAAHMLLDEQSNGHPGKNLWLSMQKTKGISDLYVQSNVWAPGGSTGWHTHPGHSLIIVTAGKVTTYHRDDRSCTPTVYSAGMGFVDAGGDHVHLIRNEGDVEARTVAVQLIPAGATRRIDAEGSTACSF